MSFKKQAVRLALNGDMRYLNALQDGHIAIDLIDNLMLPVNSKEVSAIIDDPSGYLTDQVKMSYQAGDANIIVDGDVDERALYIVQALTGNDVSTLLEEQIAKGVKLLAGERIVHIEQLNYDAELLGSLKTLVEENTVASTLSEAEIDACESNNIVSEVFVEDTNEVMQETDEVSEEIAVNNVILFEREPSQAKEEMSSFALGREVEPTVVSPTETVVESELSYEDESKQTVQRALADIFNTIREGIRTRSLDTSLGISL